MVMQNERGQLLSRHGEIGENTPFTNNVDERSANQPCDPQEGNDNISILSLRVVKTKGHTTTNT